MRKLFVVLLLAVIATAPTFAYYMPYEGRFLSRDPIEEVGGVNLYAMVTNNPILQYDQRGLTACCGNNEYNESTQCCIEKKIFEKTPIETGISINDGYIRGPKVNGQEDALLDGMFGMYNPNKDYSYRPAVWSHTYIQSEDIGFGLYSDTQRPGGPSSAKAFYGGGYIETRDLDFYPPDSDGDAFAKRKPIMLSPCEYDIAKFKNCVNAAALAHNTAYRLLWRNCITFANDVISKCKLTAKR